MWLFSLHLCLCYNTLHQQGPLWPPHLNHQAPYTPPPHTYPHFHILSHIHLHIHILVHIQIPTFIHSYMPITHPLTLLHTHLYILPTHSCIFTLAPLLSHTLRHSHAHVCTHTQHGHFLSSFWLLLFLITCITSWHLFLNLLVSVFPHRKWSPRV